MQTNDPPLRGPMGHLSMYENETGSLFFVGKWLMGQSSGAEDWPMGHFPSKNKDPVSFLYEEEWPVGHFSGEGHFSAVHLRRL